jgi:hypothetical protein
MFSDQKRKVYRQLLQRLGADDNLPNNVVDAYIKRSRIRLLVYLPICIAILLWVIHLWVR